jgi:hypothetical protein
MFPFQFRARVFVSALVALPAVGCTADRPPWRSDEILREVETELRRFDGVTGQFVEAEILMWQIEERIVEAPARRFVVQEVLLWARHRPRGSTDRWALIHAYRHPADDNVWHRSVSYVETKNEALVPHARLGYKQFDAPPSAADVCRFLRHVRVPQVLSGFRRVAGGFPRHSWRRVIGQAPPCSYGGT